jgi:hypothetical protein
VVRCFVIGPIGDKFAPIGSEAHDRYEEAIEVFEKVIFPACTQNDLEPIRADQIAVTGEITEQVFRHLYEDEVVIADLTGGNPNVMYELGLRHTRDALTIQISEYGLLPFDIAGGRTILFSRSDRGLVDARKSLGQAIAVGLAEGPDQLTATRVWLAEGGSFESLASGAQAEALPDEEPEVDELDADGFLEQMARVERAFPKLTDVVSQIGELLVTLGEEGDEAGREMNLLNETQPSASARLAYVGRYAKQLQVRADALTALSDSFVNELHDIDSGMAGVLEYIRQNAESAADAEVDPFLDGIVEMAKASRGGFENLSQFASAVRGLGPASKVLRRPANQMSRAISQMATAAAIMDDWEAAALRLKAQKSKVTAGDDQ